MSDHCRNFTSMIVDAADGSLSPDGRKALDEHLRTCAACSESLKNLSRMKKIISRLSTGYEPDPYLETRVLARVKDNIAKPGFRGFRFSPALVSGFAAVLIFAGFLITGLSGHKTQLDVRFVNYDAIDKFLVSERDTVSSYVVNPTVNHRYMLADKLYNYLESMYGFVEEKSFNATYGYLESNLSELI